jgi:hypothetical protein
LHGGPLGVDQFRPGDQQHIAAGQHPAQMRAYGMPQATAGSVAPDGITDPLARRHSDAAGVSLLRRSDKNKQRVGIRFSRSPHPPEILIAGQPESAIHRSSTASYRCRALGAPIRDTPAARLKLSSSPF